VLEEPAVGLRGGSEVRADAVLVGEGSLILAKVLVGEPPPPHPLVEGPRDDVAQQAGSALLLRDREQRSHVVGGPQIEREAVDQHHGSDVDAVQRQRLRDRPAGAVGDDGGRFDPELGQQFADVPGL
jgi:hypothetical protein